MRNSCALGILIGACLLPLPGETGGGNAAIAQQAGGAPGSRLSEDASDSDGPSAPAELLDQAFPAKDSLRIGVDPSRDARECLSGLEWQAERFDVVCEPSRGPRHGDLQVRFPSPRRSGDQRNDRVAMEWFAAKDEEGRIRPARAVVVVHESGGNMNVGRIFADGIQQHGLHAFMLHLPYYGERKTPGDHRDGAKLPRMIRQAIADVRRARDAVAALPCVDTAHIALQGTSLGGFVSATAAGLDDGFDSVHLMLAGGDLLGVIESGQKDAAKLRRELREAGLEGDKLKQLVWTVEPNRLAHRLDPSRTWLFSGIYDRVVPLANAETLAAAAALPPGHHVKLLANHYTGIVYLPTVLSQIHRQVTTVDSRRTEAAD